MFRIGNIASFQNSPFTDRQITRHEPNPSSKRFRKESLSHHLRLPRRIAAPLMDEAFKKIKQRVKENLCQNRNTGTTLKLRRRARCGSVFLPGVMLSGCRSSGTGNNASGSSGRRQRFHGQKSEYYGQLLGCTGGFSCIHPKS